MRGKQFRRWFHPWLIVVLAISVLLMAGALRYALQPQRAAAFLLQRAGHALGLEITASGHAEYTLRGTPVLVLRNVVAREPGGRAPLLRATRILISLPWSTIRARGKSLDATRLELDSPILDLPALQHWLASRPPSENRIPSFSQGLRISAGTIVDASAAAPWRIEGIQVEVPVLTADLPMHAHLRGRYLNPGVRIPVNVAVTVIRSDALFHAHATGVAVAGRVSIAHADSWRLPGTIIASGPLTLGDNGLRVSPLRLGMAARFESGPTKLPFALGMWGPLHYGRGTWALAPAGIAVRRIETSASVSTGEAGKNPVPALDAHGTLALGERLVLRLDGILANWPDAWPTLPPPLSASTSPLPFMLDYTGRPDLSQIAHLRLQRDTTRFDGHFRPRQLSDWTAADTSGSTPLPPIQGRLTTPRLEIAGAQLQGVQITLDNAEPADQKIPDVAH